TGKRHPRTLYALNPGWRTAVQPEHACISAGIAVACRTFNRHEKGFFRDGSHWCRGFRRTARARDVVVTPGWLPGYFQRNRWLLRWVREADGHGGSQIQNWTTGDVPPRSQYFPSQMHSGRLGPDAS